MAPGKGAAAVAPRLTCPAGGLQASERVCDLDFDRGRIILLGGKGTKDRVPMLSRSLEARPKSQVVFVRPRHEDDLENGAGLVPVPTSLEQKRHGAARELRWQFVLMSTVAVLIPTRDHASDGAHMPVLSIAR